MDSPGVLSSVPKGDLEQYAARAADELRAGIPPRGGHGGAHRDGEVVVVRAGQHRGLDLKVTTTYRFEVNGQPVVLHAAVSDNGQVTCHGMPYDRFDSALDMLRTTVDRYPHEFGIDPDNLGKGY